MYYIKQNLEQIENRINEAVQKSERNREDVLLLAVTKTVSAELINAALKNGITDIGENRVQELLSKYDYVNANWHLIGHLQSNKVKYIIDKVSLIHSLESISLAKEIDKRAREIDKICDCLVEINIANEDTKFGVSYENAEEFIKNLTEYPNIRVKGLMCVAPFVKTSVQNRDLFKKMRNLLVDINAKTRHNIVMDTLSMGMSGDFESAILEGSTIVRIGTSIFGNRSYSAM